MPIAFGSRAVVGAVMPTAWREPGDGFCDTFTPARYDILELSVYDDRGKPQGTALVGVLKKGEAVRVGVGFYGAYLGASDEYYRYWATEGAGAGLREKGVYHLCSGNAASCIQWQKRPDVIHPDRFRAVGPSEIREGKIHWLRSHDKRESVVAALERFEAHVKRKAVSSSDYPPLNVVDTEKESRSEESSSSDVESEEARTRLKRLKAELESAQKKLDKKDRKRDAKDKKKRRSRSRKGDKKRSSRTRKARRSPSEEAKKEKKTEKKKKKRKARSESAKQTKRHRRSGSRGRTKTASSGSEADEELFKSAKTGKTPDNRPGMDRGPFGGGPPLYYKDKEAGSESDSESVFREAPTRSTTMSGQQKLSRYSQRFPGRLASRLLIKMREASARDLVGAHNEDSSTPPLASHFLLTVLIPALGQKASLRTQRELRTLGKGLDLLAKGETGQCADLLGQRIKALDRASQEGHWQSAQYLELLPADGVTLLERDEEMYLRNEFIMDKKAKSYDKPAFPPRPPKGDGKGDRPPKGKGGGGKEPRAKPYPAKPADENKK